MSKSVLLYLAAVCCQVSAGVSPHISQIRNFGETWHTLLQQDQWAELQAYYGTDAVIVNSTGMISMERKPNLHQTLEAFEGTKGKLLQVIPTQTSFDCLYEVSPARSNGAKKFYSYARIVNTKAGLKIATQIFPLGGETNPPLGSKSKGKLGSRMRKLGSTNANEKWEKAYSKGDWVKMKNEVYTPDAVLLSSADGPAKMVKMASIPASRLATFFPDERHSSGAVLQMIQQGGNVVHQTYQIVYKDGSQWTGYGRLEKGKDSGWRFATDIWPLAGAVHRLP